MRQEFTIEWVGTPNYQQGRNGRKPIAIIDHITDGAFPGCLTWLQNPKAQVSAHYLVTKSGRILQLVKDEDTAWHAGVVNKPDWLLYDGSNPNQYTIGIEHEVKNDEKITEEQYRSTLWLHRQIIKKWSIPIDQDHIIGHYRIDSINRAGCPGKGFPWERLFKDLKGGNTQVAEQWQIDIVNQAKKAGLITADHSPNEPVEFWMLCAVALNMLKLMQQS